MERKFEMHRNSHRRRNHAAAGEFTCEHCGAGVSGAAFGTKERNHCPRCLHSLHVDIAVGDRRSLCRGIMDPISLWKRSDGEVAIIHRCRRCGTLKSNRVAGDDDEGLLRSLAELVAGVV